MVCKIIWTHDGLQSFEEVIIYLKNNFTDKEVQRFAAKVNEKLSFVQSNPHMYRRSKKFSNVHFTIILKKVLLVYRAKPRKKVIEVLQFWNGKRNPGTFKYL
jgi:plasmid stabilization system protein ParE